MDGEQPTLSVEARVADRGFPSDRRPPPKRGNAGVSKGNATRRDRHGVRRWEDGSQDEEGRAGGAQRG